MKPVSIGPAAFLLAIAFQTHPAVAEDSSSLLIGSENGDSPFHSINAIIPPSSEVEVAVRSDDSAIFRFAGGRYKAGVFGGGFVGNRPSAPPGVQVGSTGTYLLAASKHFGVGLGGFVTAFGLGGTSGTTANVSLPMTYALDRRSFFSVAPTAMSGLGGGTPSWTGLGVNLSGMYGLTDWLLVGANEDLNVKPALYDDLTAGFRVELDKHAALDLGLLVYEKTASYFGAGLMSLTGSWHGTF